jgi:hypothetical protein
LIVDRIAVQGSPADHQERVDRRDLRQIRHRGSPRLFVIQAASGAGRSSLLRAGLWPRLGRTAEFIPLAIV